MGKEVKQDIGKMMIDAILERPITFTLNKQYFYLYPPSIGTTLITSEIIKRVKLDQNMLLISEHFELLRVCTEQRDDVLRLVAIHTLAQRSDAIYEEKVLARMDELKSLTAAELVALLIACLQWSAQQEKFIKHIGLDQEKRQRERIQEIKKDKSTLTFGGRSLYGSLLDYAAERYGYSREYILWGISAVNINMMLQDSVQSVYLTEKERRQVNISTDRVIINASDKSSKAAILQELKARKRKKE